MKLISRRLLIFAQAFLILLAAGATALAEGWDSSKGRFPSDAVAGRILDINGKPIPNAKVLVTVYKCTKTEIDKNGSLVRTCDDKNPSTITFITDSDGKYQKFNLGGSYMVAAVADGYCYNMMRGGLYSPSNIEITLWPEHKIKGKVVDEAGNPVQGVKVTPNYCQAVDRRSGWNEVSFNEAPDFMKVTTGRDGSFAIPHMPDPASIITLSISFEKKGRAPVSWFFPDIERGVFSVSEEIIVVSPLACAVEATLRLPADAKDIPEKIGLTLALDKKWGGARYIAVSNGGKFRIDNIPPGKHTFTLTGQGYNFREGTTAKRYMPEAKNWTIDGTTFEAKPGETAKVDIVGIKGVLLKGTLVDKITGKPITDAMFDIYHNGSFDEGGQGRTVVDDQGRFAVRIAPGPVKLVLRDIWGTQVSANTAPTLEFNMANGEEKDITWQLGAQPQPLNVSDYRYQTFAEAKRGAEASGLQLKLSSICNGNIDLQGKLELTFTLKNVSATNQNIEQAHPTVDYILCIEDEKGNQSSLGPMIGADYRQVAKRLGLGEEVIETYSTEASRIFKEPGKYKITGARILHRQGVNEVVSNTIDVNVTNLSEPFGKPLTVSYADMWLDSEKRKQGPNASKLKLTAKPAQNIVKTGTPVKIYLELRNVSDSSVTVYAGNDWRIYSYGAISPDGVSSFGMTERFGMPSGSMVTLKPGQSLSESYQLETHSFHTSGKRQITLVRDLGEYPSTKEGTILSNTVEIDIVKDAAAHAP